MALSFSQYRTGSVLGSRALLGRTEVRPNVSPSGAAGLADEQCLDVREPDLIGPLVSANCGRVAAGIVRAVDHDAANAHLAHFAEGDFSGRFMALLKRGPSARANRQDIGDRKATVTPASDGVDKV